MKIEPEKIELEDNEYAISAEMISWLYVGEEDKETKIIINGKDYTHKCTGIILVKSND